MKVTILRAVLATTTLLLAGCGGSDGASYLVDPPARALSIVRQQAYYGSNWEMGLVVRNDPVCQRKHHLKDAAGNAKVDLYQPAPGAYILRQGKRWYVTEVSSCGFEPFKEEPQQPGELLGTFQMKADKYQFVAVSKEAGKEGNKPGAAPAGG